MKLTFHAAIRGATWHFPHRAGRLPFLLILLCCGIFPLLHFQFGTIYLYATPADLLLGTAARPFQYRILVPGLTSGFLQAVTGKTDPALGILIMIGVEALCLVLLAWTLLRLAFRQSQGSLEQASTAIPAEGARPHSPARPLDLGWAIVLLFISLAVLLITPFGPAWWYPYDVPGVLFIALGLNALHDRSWRFFFPAFAIGCLNRETILLVTFAHIVLAWRRKEFKEDLPLIVAQLLLWGGIKTLLWMQFSGNPGEPMAEFHFLENLALMLSPTTWFRLAAGPGLLWLPLLLAFHQVPDSYSKTLLPAAIPFLVMLLVVGNLLEVRIYADLIPLAFPCCVHLFGSTSHGSTRSSG